MTARPRPIARVASVVAVVVFAALACAPRPAAAASTRNYLTVQGQVLDAVGSVVPGTWVFCTGSRRASAAVDSTGAYTLEIPGATLEELERTPLRIRIQARLKGWRFALMSGATELGLEMRVTKDASRLPRLSVRSNDSSAVEAVASSVVLDANPRALLTATFVGSKGAQYDTQPAALTLGDEITVVGQAQSIPELTADANAATTMSNKPVVVTPPLVTPPPQTSPSTTAGKPTVYRPGVASDGGGSKDKPRTVHPGQASPSTSSSTTPSSGAAKPSTSATTPKPPPGDPVASRDTARASGPAADPTLKPVTSRVAPTSGVGSKAPLPESQVPATPPKPGGEPHPVPSAGPAESGEVETNVPMCDCTIRGTVEVQSDRPLTSRTQVVVAIEGVPEIAAQVEMFMGSPRAFEIHPAPCGVRRLRLYTRSKQRFVLVSAEARLVCTEGGTQQIRLVLEPVARWGTTR